MNRYFSYTQIILFTVSFFCLLLWILFTFGHYHSHDLLHLVHTTEREWQLLYTNLANHFQSGLLLTTVIFILLSIFWKRLKEAFQSIVSLSQTSFLILIVGMSAILGIIWMLSFSTEPWADAIAYHRLAMRLADGLGYIGEDGNPTAYYPIGYPLYLSFLYRVFGSSLWVGKISNLVLHIGVQLIGYQIFKRVWNEETARIGLILLALSISQVSYINILYSEITFLFVFLVLMLFIVVTLRKNVLTNIGALVTGILVGVGTYFRPVALVVLIALGLTLITMKVNYKVMFSHIAFMVLGTMLVISPNVVRNYRLFGSFVPFQTNGGINFWVGNNPQATGYYIPPPLIEITGNEVEQSRQAYAQGFEWIEAHPRDALINLVKKFFHLYHRDDQGITFSLVKTNNSPPWTFGVTSMILANLFYYVILTLFGVSLLKKWNRFSPVEYFLLFTIVLVTDFYLFYFGAHRFHYPIVPIFIGFVANWITIQHHLIINGNINKK